MCIVYIAFRQLATGPDIVCRGSNASFSCIIINGGGFELPNQWQFSNGTVISTYTPNHHLELDDVTLLVT